MKIFITLFFFLFSLSVAYSWIFYLSATIHKDYMFLFCNSLPIFICLNSRLSVVEKKQAAGDCESRPPDGRRTVGEVGGEKEMGSLHVEQVREGWVLIVGDDDEKAGKTLFAVVEEIHGGADDEEVAGDDKTLLVNVEVTRADELEAGKDDRTLSVIEETKGDELEMVEDDKTLSVIEETQDDEFEVVDDDKTLSVIEETQDDKFEVVEDDKILLVEETQDDELETVEGEKNPLVVELEAMKDDKTLLEETRTDGEREQGDSVDAISLEELNRKCEEFIRRMKEDIRVKILSVQCH